MRRRRVKKLDPITEPGKLKAQRRLKEAEAKRWCPQWDHRGPWQTFGGLVTPDNVKGEGRDLIEGTARGERCEWCGHERELTSIEIRRRLRSADHDNARVVRAKEARAARAPLRMFGARLPDRWQDKARKPAAPMLFLLDVTKPKDRHMVGRYRTLCGSKLGEAIQWDAWANDRGLLPSRCKACHREVKRVSNEHLDVLFAYMLAIGRLNEKAHPCDARRKTFDQETGRLLIKGEWEPCTDCHGKGLVQPDETEFKYETCCLCEGRGWLHA